MNRFNPDPRSLFGHHFAFIPCSARHRWRRSLLGLLWLLLASLPQVTAQAAPVPDQGQIFGTEGQLALGTDLWTQSITAGFPGQLVGIEVQFDAGGIPAGNPSITFSLYNGGNPVAGGAVFSETLSLTNADLDPDGLFYWNVTGAGLNLNPGDVFSFGFQAAATGFVFPGNDGPGYDGGDLYQNGVAFGDGSEFGPRDIGFVSYVESGAGAPPCGSFLTSDVKLSSDLSCPSRALRFSGSASNRVTLDCDGFTITTASDRIISADNVSGIAIKNCVLMTSHNQGRGLVLTNVQKSDIKDNVVTTTGNNSRGIELRGGSSSNTVSGNTIHTAGSSSNAILIRTGSDKNHVEDNIFRADGSYAVGLQSTSKNELAGNTLISPNGYFYQNRFGLNNGGMTVDGAGNIYAVENNWGSSAPNGYGIGTATAFFMVDPNTGAASSVKKLLRGKKDVGFGFTALEVLPDGSMYALPGPGNPIGLYQIDPANGKVTFSSLNDIDGIGRLNGLEAISNDTLLATTNSGSLASIDVASGDVTLIGQANIGWTDLAIHPTTGDLYTVSRNRDEASRTAHLYKIDIADGQIIAEIGDTGKTWMSDIDFAASGVLYGDSTSGLDVINITTGLATTTGGFGPDPLEPLSNKNTIEDTLMRNANGSLRFPDKIKLPTVEELYASTTSVRIDANEIEVDSAVLPFLDEPARIVLHNTDGTFRRLLVDPEDDGSFEPCPASKCKLISFFDDDLVFDVEGFTTYSSEEVTDPGLALVVDQVSASIKALEKDKSLAKSARKKLKSASKDLGKAKKFLKKKTDKALLETGKAVKDLQKAESKGALLADLLITLLVEASRSEAQDAIDDAVNELGKQSDIDKARAHMSDAQLELGRGKPDKAIGQFSQAWLDARKARKKGPIYQDKFGSTRLDLVRFESAATTLNDGTVLITGGRAVSVDYYDSALIFDPASGLFNELANSMTSPRHGHTATLLQDGRVLITGGRDGSQALDTAEIYDPASKVFTTLTTKMNAARYFHAAAMLADGRVLISGGGPGSDSSAEIYDPATGLFGALGSSMTTDRFGHQATPLPDGTVLITGGEEFPLNALDVAEVFDPITGLFTALASDTMNTGRVSHSATLLDDGTVLIAGGLDQVAGMFFDSAEIYDPGTGLFTTLSEQMISQRANHAASLLPDGRVLMVGGRTLSGLKNAETYDPASGEFALHASLTRTRSGHTATLLEDGRVLITGDLGLTDPDSAEIFDPDTDVFTALANTMTAARGGHTATLVDDGSGRVLITGGAGSGSTLDTAEYYDPVTGSFIAVFNTMSSARGSHAATLLENGTILLTGGFDNTNTLNSAEIFDPATGVFGPLAGNMTTAREGHSATLLADGRVLIAGGQSNAGIYLDSAEIYDPATGLFSALTETMTTTRDQHSATLLRDGRVLIGGGFDGVGNNRDSVEIFDPDTGQFSALAEAMTIGRATHTATMLEGGRVLLVGGEDTSLFLTDSSEIFY